MTEVCGPVLVGRRANRNHLEQTVLDAKRRIGGELQAPLGRIAGDQLIKAGLVNRDLATIQALDLAGVDVDAQNVVAGIGQTRAGH